MIVDTCKDKEFIMLSNFLLCFDFPHKDIVIEQIMHSVVCKDSSEYHIAFQFFVDTKQTCLPKECNGILIMIQVKTDFSLSCCELYVSNQYVSEYRMYNIDTSKIDLSCLEHGTIIVETKQL